ncbi:SDR family oxidoreductase [Streptomyces sp. A1-5]|uniref:SDR family oxidoreductase n=1 Tax=Streptomyces sp. A1-5 TaxID=2738410 RepID=UPI0022866903|nr:NAD(P)H-binding protein [Streptomyces sp. A1-5]UJB43376.1 NAD(P)H-binding protein [Streptomyces sp. A1-5]
MIVVTGATGNIGRSLVGRLLEEGVPVRALTRDPARAGLPARTEAVRADLMADTDLAPLLSGADALFLNLAAGGGESAQRLIDAAVEAKVPRLVFNSSLGVTDTPADETNFISRSHAAVERAVRASGLEWTFLRGGNYATNALGWAPAVRGNGVVRDPHPGAQGAPIHEADLADAAAVALLDRTGTHVHRVHRLTGPEVLTNAQQVAAIAEAIGRPVRIEQIPEGEAAEAMVGPHLPLAAARELIGLFGRTVDAPAFPVTDTVARVTGHPARSFAQWARDHAADFS